jgi:excisionase family DNA binding protein
MNTRRVRHRLGVTFRYKLMDNLSSKPTVLSVRCRAVAGGDEWLDAEAAARYLGFHVNTIYQMVRDGRLPALRFPVRIRPEDLDTCLERCRIKPGELRHLNAYASGAHLSGEPPITRRGAPDRRFGPRTAAGLHQRSASSSLSSG